MRPRGFAPSSKVFHRKCFTAIFFTKQPGSHTRDSDHIDGPLRPFHTQGERRRACVGLTSVHTSHGIANLCLARALPPMSFHRWCLKVTGKFGCSSNISRNVPHSTSCFLPRVTKGTVNEEGRTNPNQRTLQTHAHGSLNANQSGHIPVPASPIGKVPHVKTDFHCDCHSLRSGAGRSSHLLASIVSVFRRPSHRCPAVLPSDAHVRLSRLLKGVGDVARLQVDPAGTLDESRAHELRTPP